MLLADIQMSGDGSAWEEVGGAGAWLSLVVRGGAAETLLHQNSSHLAHWQAQLHVDAHAQASLHFTFTNSCGLFLGERKGVIHKVHTYRVQHCMSPRRNWDSPTPSLASECVLSQPREGGKLACGRGGGPVRIPTTGEKV
jgi:hypothetical protein